MTNRDMMTRHGMTACHDSMTRHDWKECRDWMQRKKDAMPRRHAMTGGHAMTRHRDCVDYICIYYIISYLLYYIFSIWIRPYVISGGQYGLIGQYLMLWFVEVLTPFTWAFFVSDVTSRCQSYPKSKKMENVLHATKLLEMFMLFASFAKKVSML